MHQGQAGQRLRRENSPDDELRSASFRLDADRHHAELNLCASVLADHRRLVRVAADAGVRKHHFSSEHEDLYLIYHAAWRKHWRERRYVLRRAMLALQVAGYWDGTQITENLGQCLWSADSLVALANSRLPSEHDVKRFAQDVIDLHKRAQQARHHFDYAMRSLTGEDAVDKTVPQGSANWVLSTVYASTGSGNQRRAA